MSSISGFLSVMDNHSGLARPDRFYANFTLPPQLLLSNNIVGFSRISDLTYQCHATELPGVTFHTNTYKTYGPGKTIPTVKIYNEITFSFYCTNDFYERPLFENWMNFANPENEGWDFRYKDEYTTTLNISQLGLTSDIPIYSVQLLKAYPIAVYPLALRWHPMNVFHSLDITFMYDRFTTIPSTSSITNITDNIQTREI